MREEFLHYVWKYQLFSRQNLTTTQKEALSVLKIGEHNQNSGPDFFNAQLVLSGQRWAGNVEIHLKSSDWYVHNHQKNPRFDNTILHVVWKDDMVVFDSNNNPIPTLTLSDRIDSELINRYETLYSKNLKRINCESQIHEIDPFILQNWMERLYFRRLERKSEFIIRLLEKTNNDWEAVLFQMLSKTFGSKVNGEAFLLASQSIQFGTVRKVRTDLLQLESLFFGVFNLLQADLEDEYLSDLKKEYAYLKHKFQIDEAEISIQFFRLRPLNFPTIRLSQLASLYHVHESLFSKLMEASSINEIYKIFDLKPSKYWSTHYVFGKESVKKNKSISKSFVDLIIINVILPLKFVHSRFFDLDVNEEILQLIRALNPEKNHIIDIFSSLKVNADNAMDSQSLIELKSNYCDRNRCLDCKIGFELLRGK